MKAASQLKASAPTKASWVPMGSDLVQRKCACSGSAGFASKCEGCRNDSLKLQCAAPDQSDGYAIREVKHEVLRPSGERFDLRDLASRSPKPGHDFGLVRVDDGQPRSYQPERRKEDQLPIQHFGADEVAQLSGNDLSRRIVSSPDSSRLSAAITSGEEEIDTDAEDVLTAQEVGGGGLGPTVPAAPSCAYAITYENIRDANCDDGRCGKRIMYDITWVRATGSGCPASLDGLMLTETVTNNHGCSPANVRTGAGCPIIETTPNAPGNGRLENCTDTYGVCLGTASQARIPPGGCTEIYTQQLFIGGMLAETHVITFNLTRTGAGCTGTVSRT